VNTKACLVQLLLFALLVVVLALVIRRFVLTPAAPVSEAPAPQATQAAPGSPGLLQRLLRPGQNSDQAPPAEESTQGAPAAPAMADNAAQPQAQALPQGEAAVAAAQAQATAARSMQASPAEASTIVDQGIDGLSLQLSRPLMFDVPRMRGLAANQEYVYLSVTDPAKARGFVYQLDRNRLTIRQIRSHVASNGRYQMGGLHLGSQFLWTAISGDTPQAGSRIVGIDPVTLEERTGFDVVEQIVMVAEGPDQILYGFVNDGTAIIVWASNGYQLRRHDMLCSARYSDVEVVGQSLICTGVEPGRDSSLQGVIDVIDTQSLSLLKRHAAIGLSASGEVLTARGFAYSQGVFLFAPDQGVKPHVLSFVLQPGVKLEDYVMSVAR